MQKIKHLLLFIFLPFYSIWGQNSFYWVGGGGNWNDINHWRTTSGGSTIPAVIPSHLDDVYFDHNSGFTPYNNTITFQINASCHNIHVQNTTTPPYLLGTNKEVELNIYGSSYFENGTKVDFNTIYYRHTGEKKTIENHNNPLVYISNLQIEEKTFTEIKQLNGVINLFHAAGEVKLSNNIYLHNFYYKTNEPKKLNLSSYTLEVIRIFEANQPHLQIQAENSTIIAKNFSGHKDQKYNKLIIRDLSYNNRKTIVPVLEGGAFYINELGLMGSIDIFSNNTVGSLKLLSNAQQSGIISLYHPDIFHIENEIDIAPAFCSGHYILQGLHGINSAGNKLRSININENARVNFQNLSVSYINITGKNITGEKIINLGENMGINFTTPQGRTLYFRPQNSSSERISWNNPANWQDSNGQNCLPLPIDTVIFDSSSTGKNIYLEADAFCKNIYFNDTSEKIITTLTDKTFNIYGNTELQNNISVEASTYFKNTDSPKYINPRGGSFQNITLAEHSTIDIINNLKATNFYHDAGQINTNDHLIQITNYLARSGNIARVLKLGSSTLQVAQVFNSNNSFTEIIPDNSHIIIQKGSLTAFPNHHFNNITFTEKGFISTVYNGQITANTVTFLNDGNLQANATFKNLILSAGFNYEFTPISIHIKEKMVLENTPCGNISRLEVLNRGKENPQVKIIFNENAIAKIHHAIIKGIKAQGGNFPIYQGIDAGNNENWQFINNPDNIPTLYWVGGSSGQWKEKNNWNTQADGLGQYCSPTPFTNVIIDASKNVNIIAQNAYAHNISVLSPTRIRGKVEVYGSGNFNDTQFDNLHFKPSISERTITGSATLINNLNIEDKNYSTHIKGNFITDNLSFAGEKLITQGNIQSRRNFTIEKGNIFLENANINAEVFFSNFPGVIINPDQSKITVRTLRPHTGSEFNEVYIKNGGGIYGNNLRINKAYFTGNGDIYGNNFFKELYLKAGGHYSLEENKTQTIGSNLQINGSPCAVTSIKSTGVAKKQQAFLAVKAGQTKFNFVNLHGINASDKTLYFEAQSILENQLNSNVIFPAYDPSSLKKLGDDWLCPNINPSNPDTYLIKTNHFFTTNEATFKWYKFPDYDNVISTERNLDIRPLGKGTYKVVVDYSPYSMQKCVIEDEINIGDFSPAPPQVAEQKACYETGISLRATAKVEKGCELIWYDKNNEITTNPQINFVGKVTFFAVAQNPITGCQSSKVAVTLELTQAQAPQAINEIHCVQNDIIPVLNPQAIISDNQKLIWFNSLEDTEPITQPVTNSIGTHTFYAQAVDNTTGCHSTRTPVTVTIHPEPPSPTALHTTACFEENNTLTAKANAAEGFNLVWYDKNGHKINTPQINFVGEATFFATAQNPLTGCESPKVAVKVQLIEPKKPKVHSVIVCPQKEEVPLKAFNFGAALPNHFLVAQPHWNTKINLNVKEKTTHKILLYQQNTTGCLSQATEVEVIINDTEAPVLNIANPIHVQCLSPNINEKISHWLNLATAYDNCTDAIAVKYTYNQPTNWCDVDKIAVHFTATDTFGNTANQIAYIYIDDNSKPAPPEENNNCEVVVFNGISTKKDYFNDGFYIQNIECYPKNKLKIFNRWGALVFEQNNYTNQNSFNGRNSKGGKLPQGVYFYTLTLYRNNTEENKQGYLFLMN